MTAIAPPNYTQIPNDVLDRMHEYGAAEFKVIMAICRVTFGWHKEWETLTLTDLERMTGLSRATVHTGIEAAVARGIVKRAGTSTHTRAYGLVVTGPNSEQPTSIKTELVDFQQPTSIKTEPILVQNLDQDWSKNHTSHHIKEREKNLKKSNDRSTAIFLSLTNAGFTTDQAGTIERSILAGDVERLIAWVDRHRKGEDGVRNPFAVAVSRISAGFLPFESGDDANEIAADAELRAGKRPLQETIYENEGPRDEVGLLKMAAIMSAHRVKGMSDVKRNPYQTSGPDQ